MKFFKALKTLTLERNEKEALPRVDPNLQDIFILITFGWLIALFVFRYLFLVQGADVLFVRVALAGVFLGLPIGLWEYFTRSRR